MNARAAEQQAVRGPALSRDDRLLIDALHGGFPLDERPFALLAERLDTSEDALIARIQRLLADGALTRFGPLYQIERAGGRFVLAALQAPRERYDEIAAIVNGFAEVAHNYEREHALNMWFVLAVEKDGDEHDAIARIEAATGLPVFAFPKEREFFVELRLPPLPDEVAP